MSAIDFEFLFIFAAGFVTGLGWAHREALVDALLGMLDDEPAPRVLPQSHPSVRILRQPFDYERDA